MLILTLISESIQLSNRLTMRLCPSDLRRPCRRPLPSSVPENPRSRRIAGGYTIISPRESPNAALGSIYAESVFN